MVSQCGVSHLPGAVGVVDLLAADDVDRVLGGLRPGDRDSGVSALGEDNGALLLGVLLGELGDLLSDLLDVLGSDVVGLSVSRSLGFVANEDVDVGQDRVELVLEELRDERRGEVDREYLARG